MKTFNTLRVIFTLVGLGMLAGAFFAFQSTSTFLETATAKPGIVTDLIRSRSSNSNAYYPIVRFEYEPGRPVEFQSSSGSNPASYSRGEEIRVLFTPGEPESARIDDFFSLWGAALIVGGIGAAFFSVGAVCLLCLPSGMGVLRNCAKRDSWFNLTTRGWKETRGSS